MNANCRSTLTVMTMMLLGMAVGCAEEGDNAAPAPTVSHSTPPAPNQGIPPAPAPTPSPTKTEDMKKPADGPKKSDDAPKVEGPKSEAPKADASTKLGSEEMAEIKKLPEAEQAAAIKQAVCPVSAHELGSMGEPIKVSAEGRTFYLCCKSCQDAVKKDPKAVIAKLDKKS